MQATGSGTEDLPPGWERQVDPGSGVAFYIDHTTKRTTWEHPGTAAAPARPQAPPHPLVQRTWALLSWLVGATHDQLTTEPGLLPRAVLLLDRWFEVRPGARKPVHGGRYIGLRAGEIEDWFARGPEAVLEEVRGLEVALRETYFAGSEHSAGLPGSNVGGWVYFAGPAGQEAEAEEPVILDGTARLATVLQFPCAIPFQEVLRHFFFRPARKPKVLGRPARPFQPAVGPLVDAPAEMGGADADDLLSAVANNDRACLIWGDTVGDVEVSRSIDFGRLLADDDGGAAGGVGELRFRQLEVRNAGTGAVFLLSIRPSNSLFVLQDDHGVLVSADSQDRPDKAVRLGPGDVYPVTVILNAAKRPEECGCLQTSVVFSFFAAGGATLHGLRTRGIPHVRSRGDGASFCIARTVLATVVPTHLKATFQLDVDAQPFVGRELREQWSRSPTKVETAPPLGMDAYHDARAVSRPRRCGEKRGLRRAGLTRGRAESRQHLGPRICIAGSSRAAGATLGPAADLGGRGAARAAEAVRPLQRGRQRLAAERSRDCIPRLRARRRDPALRRAAA